MSYELIIFPHLFTKHKIVIPYELKGFSNLVCVPEAWNEFTYDAMYHYVSNIAGDIMFLFRINVS